MILTEEMLRAAAAEAEQAIRMSLPAEDACSHRFSAGFERRMRRIIRKGRHPVAFRIGKAASFFLVAAVLGSTTWLTIDAGARDVLFSWIKEQCGIYTVYRFTETSERETPSYTYRLTWIPEGYSEYWADKVGATTIISYADEQGRILDFHYCDSSDEADWFLVTEHMEVTSVTVNGGAAELYLSQDPNGSNALIWTSGFDTVFYLSGFFQGDELVKMAESVQREPDTGS